MPEYGFHAIARHNGWEMALLGILIVFTGLSLLAFSISRLHRILDFFEKKKTFFPKKNGGLFGKFLKKNEAPVFTGTPEFRPAWQQYRLLMESLPRPLALPHLLALAEKRGVPRCHAVLADLLRAGVLQADGAGFYVWDMASFERISDSQNRLAQGQKAKVTSRA